MAWYKFRCETCGAEGVDSVFVKIGEEHPEACEWCGGRIVRLASFQFNRGVEEHYNTSIGEFVTSEKQFRERLKVKSAEMSERTGMEHKYQPVDVADQKAVGATDEGLDHTARVRRSKGMDQAPTRKIFT